MGLDHCLIQQMSKKKGWGENAEFGGERGFPGNNYVLFVEKCKDFARN